MEREFDLKLSDGTIVKWFGTSGENAAKRFIDSHPTKTIVAWREVRFDQNLVNQNLSSDRQKITLPTKYFA